MDEDFKNYDWKEGVGAAIYAILATTFVFGFVIGLVITLILK